MESNELDFELPPELIAQEPTTDRAASRLLHYGRDERTLAHRTFSDLPGLLRAGDLLVFNDAQVLPARFMLRKNTGGRVEGLYLETVNGNEPSNGAEPHDVQDIAPVAPGFAGGGFSRIGSFFDVRMPPPAKPGATGDIIDALPSPSPCTQGEGGGGGSATWRVLLRDIGRTPLGARLTFESAPTATAEILDSLGDGEYILKITADAPETLLKRIGRMPLPPYIHRARDGDARDAMDRQRYQTVYAAAPGSVAAPTAGLHFTPEILDALDNRNIERTAITLHVGRGTFKPVTAETLELHSMHREEYEITEKAAEQLNRAESEGRRIVAIGTTSARVLESHPKGERWTPTRSSTQIFIYPPYEWKRVQAMVTNFHLPKSTLIALVAAMTGLDEQRKIYRTAIEERYRFFSYGDAMLIE